MENRLIPRDQAPLLEVIALTPADAEAAQDGGADRLEVVSDMAADGLSPTPETVAAIRSACDLSIRAMVRTTADFSCHDQAAIIRRATDLVEAGADGLVMGFLAVGKLDAGPMRAVWEAVGRPWTCHRAVDHADDYGQAIAEATSMPGVDQILTAGSARGLGVGLESVAANAAVGPLMAGGGLAREHVARLREAGVTAFHIGSAARPSWDSPVDPGRVAAWRAALDR